MLKNNALITELDKERILKLLKEGYSLNSNQYFQYLYLSLKTSQDNSNPLEVYVGNPDLKIGYTQNFNIGYLWSCSFWFSKGGCCSMGFGKRNKVFSSRWSYLPTRSFWSLGLIDFILYNNFARALFLAPYSIYFISLA